MTRARRGEAAATLYDTIGVGYATRRVADVRIAAQIRRALADARAICNIGAGAGAYEPTDLDVTAVEPSERMIQQRRGAQRVVRAVAEHLPFDDGVFDAAMAVLTIRRLTCADGASWTTTTTATDAWSFVSVKTGAVYYTEAYDFSAGGQVSLKAESGGQILGTPTATFDVDDVVADIDIAGFGSQIWFGDVSFGGVDAHYTIDVDEGGQLLTHDFDCAPGSGSTATIYLGFDTRAALLGDVVLGGSNGIVDMVLRGTASVEPDNAFVKRGASALVIGPAKMTLFDFQFVVDHGASVTLEDGGIIEFLFGGDMYVSGDLNVIGSGVIDANLIIEEGDLNLNAGDAWTPGWLTIFGDFVSDAYTVRLGDSDGDVLGALQHLAALYMDTDRSADALACMELAYAGSVELRGEDHPYTIVAMGTLAGLYETERPEESERLMRRGLALAERVFDPEHPTRAQFVTGLARLLMGSERPAEAIPLLEEALAMVQSRLGPEHSRALFIMAELGNAHGLAGRYESADEWFVRAIEGGRRVLGPRHFRVGIWMVLRAENLRNTDRADEALPLLVEALDLLETEVGREHERTRDAVRHLSLVYRSLDRGADADALESEYRYEVTTADGESDSGPAP